MKLLVCTDGSEHSFKAVKKAGEIARGQDNSQVSLLFAYDIERISAEASGPTLESIKELRKQRGEEILEEAEKLLNDYNITSVNKIYKEGHPVAEIIEEASKNDYDIVIIGNRGLGRIRSMILGSVSNAVVQEVKTNVLIVKE